MVLSLFILAIGVALAVSGSFTFWPVQVWYDFYKPLVLFIGGSFGGLVFTWILYFLVVIPMSKTKEYDKPSVFARVIFIWLLDFVDRHARIKVIIKGGNKVPAKERFLVVCNHKSRFDSMIITQYFGNRDIAFMTKRDNMKIPLANKLMNRLCYPPLDREDKIQSLSQMRRAEKLITDDVSSVGVFPEGTRYPDDVLLGDFHEGVFNIALKAKAPVLVCVEKHSHDVHRNWPWKSTKVELNILGLITYDEMQGKTAKEVSDEVHEIMVKALTE